MNPQNFDELKQALDEGGADALLDRLIERLEEEQRFAALFDALMMKMRRRAGFPLHGEETLKDFPEEQQGEVERFYIEACRRVGTLHLDQGDIPGAWTYFQAIDEPERVAQAIDAWSPPADEGGGEGAAADASSAEPVIEIAFQEGASPVRGFELILAHQGTCRAVSVFEHQFPHSREVRVACARRLVAQVYDELLESLRRDIETRGEAVHEGSTVRSLIEGRPWLAEEPGRHIDLSHLQAAIRAATWTAENDTLEQAIQLCDYGRLYPPDPALDTRGPFADFYSDHRIFFLAQRGEGIDGATRFFRSRAEQSSPDAEGRHPAGEVLVTLLHRAGRHGEAIEAYARFLQPTTTPPVLAPSLLELCRAAGDYSRLIEISRDQGDPLLFAAGWIEQRDLEQSRGARSE